MNIYQYIENMANACGFSYERLKERNNRPEICVVRFLIWRELYSIKREYGVTDIGRMFNRTHATIISGLKRISALLETNDPFALEMKKRIKGLPVYDK